MSLLKTKKYELFECQNGYAISVLSPPTAFDKMLRQEPTPKFYFFDTEQEANNFIIVDKLES